MVPAKNQIERAAAALIGLELWNCTRAVNMAMFQFGERRNVPGTHGKEKEVGTLALHVQCRWRITADDRILVGSRDISYPADHSEGQEIPESFDWDRDHTRLDKSIEELFDNGKRSFVVRQVRVGAAGALQLVLDDGMRLDLFPDDSLMQEDWRLFRPGSDQPHFVVPAS